MKKNDKILSILEENFNDNHKKIQNYTFEKFIDLLIEENPDAYYISEDYIGKLYNEEVVQNFNMAKSNKKLVEAFRKIISFSINEDLIQEEFKINLKESFIEIKSGLKTHEDSKIQIIFFTYDFEPYAWISGFGEGNYPILEKPEYFEFNYQKDFFEILGKINYSNIWKEQRELEELLEQANIFNEIFDTIFFQSIRNCSLYKTYIILNKALKSIENEIFENLDLKKPLFIYGNEHGCEYTNIFCYE